MKPIYVDNFYFNSQIKKFPKYFEKMIDIPSFMECKACKRQYERKMIVPPKGDKLSRVVFVGREPGTIEEIEGVPFVQATKHGQILDEFLIILGFNRKDVYISNSLFCRGKDSRPPEADEILPCMWWKSNELDWNYRIIFTLGKDATMVFIGEHYDFNFARNKIFYISGFKSVVIPLHHPGHLMRQNRVVLKEQKGHLIDMKDQIIKIKKHLEEKVNGLK